MALSEALKVFVDTILYCSRCWLEQTRRAPMPPCRRCGGLAFEPQLDIEKRNAVLATAWPIGITEFDRVKYFRDLKIAEGDALKKLKR